MSLFCAMGRISVILVEDSMSFALEVVEVVGRSRRRSSRARILP